MVLQEQKQESINCLKTSPIAFWIDSSGGPKEYCNLSLYGIDPKYYFYGSLNEVTLHENDSGAISFIQNNCFDFLEEKLNEEKHNKNGIFVGYFAYNLSQSPIQNYKSYPDFFFAYFDKANSQPLISNISDFKLQHSDLISNMTDEEYINKVRLIKEEIKAGNVYQVNLTREYSLGFLKDDSNELELYLRLRSVSPNPYGGYLKTPFVSILSSSPEEFIYIQSSQSYIRTRPIKGTFPKNIFDIDSKNMAENIMIVDLERNDLGKICDYGSVQAKKLLEIESYEHLNHIVSTVEGKLKSNIKLRQIFEALFPGGSITGAPKIAAMKIIDKLEPIRRGAYTGSFGYIKTDGTMSFNILIRTLFIQENKITFNIGGGIVADSDPQSELEEIHLKARGIIEALRL